MDLITLLTFLSITGSIVVGLIAFWGLWVMVHRPRCYGFYYATMHSLNKPNCWRCHYRVQCREKSEL